jgi:endonuclease/exonuclease/phosphatase family metal-dependent hydrolase
VDLNASPGTVRTDDAWRIARVRRAKPLWAMSGTWPSWLPWPARVAIDDVLVSPGVGVRSWDVVGDACGSDHLPVVVELTIEGRSTGASPQREAGTSAVPR